MVVGFQSTLNEQVCSQEDGDEDGEEELDGQGWAEYQNKTSGIRDGVFVNTRSQLSSDLLTICTNSCPCPRPTVEAPRSDQPRIIP